MQQSLSKSLKFPVHCSKSVRYEFRNTVRPDVDGRASRRQMHTRCEPRGIDYSATTAAPAGGARNHRRRSRIGGQH